MEVIYSPHLHLACSLAIQHVVPQDSPHNLTVVSAGAFSLQLSWSPPSQANGAITCYTLTVKCSGDTKPLIVQVDPHQLSYNVSGLVPYELVTVSLTASTNAGEGPSIGKTFCTNEYGKEYLYVTMCVCVRAHV